MRIILIYHQPLSCEQQDFPHSFEMTTNIAIIPTVLVIITSVAWQSQNINLSPYLVCSGLRQGIQKITGELGRRQYEGRGASLSHQAQASETKSPGLAQQHRQR
jgi:hypothetical protein